MRILILLLLAAGHGHGPGRLASARDLTTFELVNSNGNLNGSIDVQVYNETSGGATSVAPAGPADSQNGTSSTLSLSAGANNRTDKAGHGGWAIFSPDFWSNLLGVFTGNVKLGIHGDLSNVASGNLESRGSVGVSLNGQDMSVGAKFGVGGNLGQGVSNTGSIGAGGKVMAKPTFHFQRPQFSLAKMPMFANGQVKEVNANAGNGNWQNIKQYFKVFVDKQR